MSFDFDDFQAELGLMVKSVVIDPEFGYTGYALFAEIDDQDIKISGDLASIEAVRTWTAENFRMVETIATTGILPPSQRLINAYRRNVKASLEALNEKEKSDTSMRDTFVKVFASGEGNPDYEAQGRESLAELEKSIAKIGRHKARLEGYLETLKTDPTSLFLPIGATVEFKEDFGLDDDWALGGSYYGHQYPKGTKGVVVGVPNNGEFGVLVATYGNIEGDVTEYKVAHLFLNAADVNVLELGKFVDGSTCRSLDFVRTHVHEEFEEDYGDMVVLANGYAWRVQAFQLDRPSFWTEGEAWPSLERLSFLELYDPDIHFEAPEGPGM